MDYQQKQLENISLHKFDPYLIELLNSPYIFDEWQIQKVGDNNDGPYRQEYSKLPVQDCGEPLVNCLDYGLIGKDYYFNVLWDQNNEKSSSLLNIDTNHFFPFAWVRESLAKKLQILDTKLREHGLFVVINSGWRHPETQTMASKLMQNDYSADYLNKALAPSSITPHSTGGAVDLELWSLQTSKPLSFSYPNDTINSFVLENNINLTDVEITKRNIRRILFHLSSESGLVSHPGEFWHFGFGDPLSSYLLRQPSAVYGSTSPPSNYRLHLI